MKRVWILALFIGSCLYAPLAMHAQQTYDHAEVGVFADYLRFSPLNTNINFVGVGGRVGFNVHPNIMLEAEMNYDFSRNYTLTTSNGVSTSFSTTGIRPLTGLFGPKFQAGTSGPVRFFVTGKVGFIDFSTTTAPVTGGTVTNTLNGIGGSSTHVAFYPGVGLEGFWGPFGLRLDVGDELYLNNGTFNNLRVTFGPHFRF